MKTDGAFIICPTSEFELAYLFVKWKILDFHNANTSKHERWNIIDSSVIVYDLFKIKDRLIERNKKTKQNIKLTALTLAPTTKFSSAEL